jgi:hypothetical protein
LPALALLAPALFFPQGAQAYGNTFFASLLLFIGLAIELLRYKRKGRQGQSTAHLARTRLPIPWLINSQAFGVNVNTAYPESFRCFRRTI